MGIAEPVAATIRFTTKLEADGTLGLPKSAEPVPDGTMLEAVIGGFPLRAPVRDANIELSKNQRSAAGLKAGETVSVEITRLDDEPEVRTPQDLLKALKSHMEAHDLYGKITPNARREWVRWVVSAKQEETRRRRIEVGIDKLNKGMRRPCCFPGLNWVTKDHVSPEETWVSLPKAKD